MLCILAGARSFADDLPVKIQALLFKKILLYDRSLPSGPRYRARQRPAPRFST